MWNQQWYMYMCLMKNLIVDGYLDHIVARLVPNWLAPIEGDVLSNLSFEMFERYKMYRYKLHV